MQQKFEDRKKSPFYCFSKRYLYRKTLKGLKIPEAIRNGKQHLRVFVQRKTIFSRESKNIFSISITNKLMYFKTLYGLENVEYFYSMYCRVLGDLVI